MSTLNIGVVGLGWLGLPLAMALKEEGHAVWGSVRTHEKKQNLPGFLQAIVWKIGDGLVEEMKNALKQTDLLFFNIPPSRIEKEEYLRVLSEVLNDLKWDGRVIFASSTGVYSSQKDAKEDVVFNEEEEENINLRAERKVQALRPKQYTILRLAGLIGEDRNPVVHLAKKKENHNPNTPINLIHREDIIEVVRKLLKHPLDGEILNIVHPNHPTRKDYYTQKAIQLNTPIPHFTTIQNDSVKKIVNCSKLISYLENYSFLEI